MAPRNTKLSVLPKSDQPTRGLESYVGKIYRNPDHRFSIYDYDSSFLQERTRRQDLYNSIPFGGLHTKIKSVLSAPSCREVVDINSILSQYVIFSQPSPLNPLDHAQTQKVFSLLDFFKDSLQRKIILVERDWKEREKEVISPALPFRFKKEKMVHLDNLTEEYLGWTSPAWLAGQFQIPGNKSILDYGRVIRRIDHFEKTFWQARLHTYQSAIFNTITELEEEKKYLHHHYREQFASSGGQDPLHLLRLQVSLPHQFLQELNYLQSNLASANEIKIFIQTKLRRLDEDKKKLSANGKSGDSLTELRSGYPLLSQQFPGRGGQLLYFGPLLSVYEQQRENFYKILQELELSLGQQRAAERKSRENHFSHPLVISLEPFDISAYVQRYAPSTPEMQQVQKLLLGQEGWERKMERLPTLLGRKPSFYSERDKDFLNSVIFALETSQKEGVLEYLCREKPALGQKINAVLSALHTYAQRYTLYS